jgi:hypothetical protein
LETISVLPDDTVRLDSLGVAADKVTTHDCFESTTSSPACGITPPSQFEAVFQSPPDSPEYVTVAAEAVTAVKQTASAM